MARGSKLKARNYLRCIDRSLTYAAIDIGSNAVRLLVGEVIELVFESVDDGHAASVPRWVGDQPRRADRGGVGSVPCYGSM